MSKIHGEDLRIVGFLIGLLFPRVHVMNTQITASITRSNELSIFADLDRTDTKVGILVFRKAYTIYT